MVLASTPATPNRNGYLSSPPPAPRKRKSNQRNPNGMSRGNLSKAFNGVA